MPSLSQDLAARRAPLEYWFIKLHTVGLAFLVDFIVRRPIGQAEVRVSLWVRGDGHVARRYATSWRAADEVGIAESLLGAAHSTGAVEGIEWDLTYEPGAGRAAPRVPLLSALHPFDLELVSRPGMVFSGDVVVGGERFDVREVRGSLTHYWGRRLPDRWHWISADAFGETDLAVEAVAMRSRLWGLRPVLAVGYLWTRRAGRQQMLISPLNGLITISGSLEDYHLVARRPGGTTHLHCSAPPERYNDLGEGIHQTLHGSCAVLGDGLVDDRAGLEYRVRPVETLLRRRTGG